MGKHEPAIADFSQVIKLDPSPRAVAAAYTNRGMSYDSLQQFQSAIKDYDQALQLNPLSFRAYNNQGSSPMKLNEYQKALDDLNEALSINPEFGLGFTSRGNTFSKLGESKKASPTTARAASWGMAPPASPADICYAPCRFARRDVMLRAVRLSLCADAGTHEFRTF